MPLLTKSPIFWLTAAGWLLLALPVGAVTNLKVDEQHVREWNRFAARLFALHQHQLEKYDTYQKITSGGYATHPDFYQQISYYNKENDRLLSRIQWEIKRPDTLHSIAVYVYDEQGVLQRDYLAAFLPRFRNAPVQTLINLHHIDRELKAFRQFDASGNRIYEQCSGEYFGKPFTVSLEEHQIPSIAGRMPKHLGGELYRACFSKIPSRAGRYLDPLAKTSLSAKDTDSPVSVSEKIRRLSELIDQQPGLSKNYVQRARHWFDLHEFERAIADLNIALELDSTNDEAYLWRGMALGRNGKIREGIVDLTEYIERVPDSSLAYTKRGMRYIWNGEIEKARQDLLMAIELDGQNAEAHDDLGVIDARQGNFDRAVSHFKKVIDIDPAYFKAYHNLAMTYYLQDKHFEAYQYVNKALSLEPRTRSTMMLKAEILEAIGKEELAREIRSEARYIAHDNWHEVWPENN